MVVSGSPSTDPRERITHQHVDDAGAAVSGDSQDGSSRRDLDTSDDRRGFTSGDAPDRIERPIRGCIVDDRDQLAFVGDVERIQTEELAGAAHFLAHRHGVLVENDPESRVACELVERRREPVVTKIDLASAVGFDRDALMRNLDEVRPGLPVLETSARTGEGFADWMAWLERRAASEAAAPDDPRLVVSAAAAPEAIVRL
jgi:hypothetical protein